MQKTCKICGATFVPHNRQLCCSPECSIKNRYAINKRYQNKPENVEKRHKKYRECTKGNTVCKLCGKPTEAGYTNYKPHYHDECIINEAIEIIKSGQNLTDTQYSRLFQRGYTIGYIREIIKESEENGK